MFSQSAQARPWRLPEGAMQTPSWSMPLALSRSSCAAATGSSAHVAGFGRAISEVGAVLMVGGDIEGYTRVMTTAIVLETRKGNFELAITLGVLLLGLSFVVNLTLQLLQPGIHSTT